MTRLANPVAVVAGIVWILIVNLALLGAATWNARGEPLSQLQLTERELALRVDRQEPGAGIVLSLRLAGQAPRPLQRAAWIRRADLPQLDLPWFDRKKLRNLGFPVDVDPGGPRAAQYYNHAQFRRVYIALEYDGDAWDRWIASRERELELLRRRVERGSAEASDLTDGEAQLAFDRVARSRLVPLDVGLDASELQERHADPQRFVVLPGLVRPRLDESEEGRPVLLGSVVDLLARWVHVPRRHRGPLEPLMPTEKSGTRRAREREQAREGWPAPTPPRYQAELAVGRSHASWLVQVEALEPAAFED